MKTHNVFSQNDSKPRRKLAQILGGALIGMAVLSGIAIPKLGTLTADVGLIGIFLLDILVSFGIFNYHKNSKPFLAKATSILRLFYTAVFGIAIAYHIANDVAMFRKFWEIGLIIFGIHLIGLGILFDNEDGKKSINILIKSMLLVAGFGYLIQYIGILFVHNPKTYAALIESIFIAPMILGEILYALWMLVQGGKYNK